MIVFYYTIIYSAWFQRYWSYISNFFSIPSFFNEWSRIDCFSLSRVPHIQKFSWPVNPNHGGASLVTISRCPQSRSPQYRKRGYGLYSLYSLYEGSILDTTLLSVPVKPYKTPIFLFDLRTKWIANGLFLKSKKFWSIEYHIVII